MKFTGLQIQQQTGRYHLKNCLSATNTQILHIQLKNLHVET